MIYYKIKNISKKDKRKKQSPFIEKEKPNHPHNHSCWKFLFSIKIIPRKGLGNGCIIRLTAVEALEFKGRRDGRTVRQHLMPARFDDGTDYRATGGVKLLETP